MLKRDGDDVAPGEKETWDAEVEGMWGDGELFPQCVTWNWPGLANSAQIHVP